MRVETNVLALYHETNAGHATICLAWRQQRDNVKELKGQENILKNVKVSVSTVNGVPTNM